MFQEVLAYQFVRGDVCDRDLVSRIFADFQPDVVMHFAAESHVDRSIDNPGKFIQTNIVGTSIVLECAESIGRGCLLIIAFASITSPLTKCTAP